MEITFLESSNGLKLSKTISPKETKSYPNVRLINSIKYNVPKTTQGIKDFEILLREHARKGDCLLKGGLRKKLINQSRAGQSDKNAYADYVVFDLDNVLLPQVMSKSLLTANDVVRIAEIVVTNLPGVFHDVTYVAQASSSLGMNKERVSIHIFMFLETPLPPKTLKLWLRHINYNVDLFNQQIELSNNGQSLKYTLDPSVADNTKVIFIAPPDFTDKTLDPFKSPEERIVLVERGSPTVDIAPLMSEVSPEKNYTVEVKIKDALRSKAGLSKRTGKINTTLVNNQTHEILTNPDKMSITIVDDTSKPFIRCNINGGDSNAYYFNLEDPTYMFNFKDEPIFEIEKADREFYVSIFDTYESDDETNTKALLPVILRDFYTDTYYNGVFDPNLNQFTEDFPLTPTNKTSIVSFIRSHGRAEPDFVPDAQVVFDPSSSDKGINLKEVPYYVNTYKKSQYVLNAKEPTTPLEYGTAVTLADICPLTYKLMHHMLGNGAPETEHFVNWLAYIYQKKRKSMTAWILTGVPGTGKGLFVNKILKPLFGQEQVPMKNLENIEEQFNLYMRSALFLIIDEFRMTDANGGSLRMADKLKNQITEPTLTIRAMRSNQTELPSFTNFIFLTNRPDAVKIEPGDRRYNVSPRQELKLDEVYPEVIENIDNLHLELNNLAGVLQTFKVDTRMARTCMNNEAKAHMRNTTMSIFEEFCDALKQGKLEFFTDVLDISLNNVLQAGNIMNAQRFVKAWIADAHTGYSIVKVEFLRNVFHVQTEQNPPLSIRQFNKQLERNGLTQVRKRENNSNRDATPIRGIVVTWKTNAKQLKELVDLHFDANDQKLLRTVNKK